MTVLDHAPAAAPDRHIASYTSLPTPAELCEELPLEPARAEQIARSREAVRAVLDGDRKSTRLNSSHVAISYAVFCLKKKTRNCYTNVWSCSRAKGLPAVITV